MLIARSETVKQHAEALGTPCYRLRFAGIVDPFTILRLTRIILRHRPAIVHIHHFKDLFAVACVRRLCRIFGVRFRIVCTRHLIRPGKRSPFHSWIYRAIDRLIFVSEHAREAFFATRPDIERARTHVILNSIPTPPPQPAPLRLRNRYALGAEVPILLFCGRCVPEKGCDTLLRACSLLGERPYALFLAGACDGAYFDRLQRIVVDNRLENRVFFLGFVPHADRLAEQADISVQPSIVPEAGSLSVLEAMRAGCAVVASDNGSQPEFIDDAATGLLVPPGDARALAEALSRLLDDPALVRNLGGAARRKFEERFSYERFYHKYIALYDE